MNTTAVLIIMAWHGGVAIDHIHFADMASCEAAREAIFEVRDKKVVHVVCAPGGIPAGR